MVWNLLSRREARFALIMALLLSSLLLGLAVMLLAGRNPDRHGVQRAGSPVQQMVATDMPTPLSAAEPAIVTVQLPARRVEGALLELTVRPERTSSEEAYLVIVSELCGSSEEEKALGSFSFFPPPSKGKERSFLVPAPSCAAPGTAARVKLQMIPAEPGGTLEASAVSIVTARIAE